MVAGDLTDAQTRLTAMQADLDQQREETKEPEDTSALVKALMNDTYKQLYGHFANDPGATFTASDVTRAVKSVLKAVTNKHLQ